jgi:isochorismate pyruvate lyase
MVTVKECKNLNEVRSEIDLLDSAIVDLISKRNAYIHQAAKFKVSVEEVKDEKRVADVIGRVREAALDNSLNPNMMQEIYELMINEMVESEIAEFRNAKDL